MIKRFIGIFEYYAIHHLEIPLPGKRIDDSEGRVLGYLEDVRFKHNSVHIRGWTIADALKIRLDEYIWRGAPSVERNDVAEHFGCNANVGFNMRLPRMDAKEFIVTLTRDGQKTELPVPLPGPDDILKARRRLWRSYIWRMLRMSPGILKKLVMKEPDLRYSIKAGLDLVGDRGHKMLDARVFDPPHRSAPPVTKTGVTIILPIHNAFDLLQACLQRVARHTGITWRIVIVEDASTDARVRPWLQDWCGQQRAAGRQVVLIENEKNLGFIRSVNRALELAPTWGDPVVLLNSDAMVPQDWAVRLLAPIWRDGDSVASVTPMSNDAEIFSAPVICCPTQLSEGQVDRMDAVAGRLGFAEASVPAPTGVGFCMAMSPGFLRRIPFFDAAFGRGYGEEVDWCRKAAVLGGKHVAAANLFVEHCGGQSFGSEEKKRLVARNNAEIARRYPGYDASVQEFIRDDPLLTVRAVLALAYLDTLDGISEVPVFIAHTMGGGAEDYLQSLIRGMSTKAAVILRFGGETRCAVEVITPEGMTTGCTDDLATAAGLIKHLQRRKIVYSCAVGDTDPIEIPAFLQEISKGKRLEILFHDYFPLSPSYTLLDHDRIYRGVPQPGRADPAHRSRRSNGERVTLQQWREAWGALIEDADQLVVFSENSRSHVLGAYPGAADKLTVAPHELRAPVPRLKMPRSRDRLVIGVPGNIGPQKGAAVVQELSRMAEHDNAVDLVLMGKLDPAFQLSSGTRNHGRYELADFPILAQEYQINAWLIPSIWPETFSYTTHECLATGLPVVAFDLGAQGEAVNRAANGHVVSLNGLQNAPRQLAKAVLEVARKKLAAEQGRAQPKMDCPAQHKGEPGA